MGLLYIQWCRTQKFSNFEFSRVRRKLLPTNGYRKPIDSCSYGIFQTDVWTRRSHHETTPALSLRTKFVLKRKRWPIQSYVTTSVSLRYRLVVRQHFAPSHLSLYNILYKLKSKTKKGLVKSVSAGFVYTLFIDRNWVTKYFENDFVVWRRRTHRRLTWLGVQFLMFSFFLSVFAVDDSFRITYYTIVANHLHAECSASSCRPMATTNKVKVAPTTADSLTSLHGISPANITEYYLFGYASFRILSVARNESFLQRCFFSLCKNFSKFRRSGPIAKCYSAKKFAMWT